MAAYVKPDNLASSAIAKALALHDQVVWAATKLTIVATVARKVRGLKGARDIHTRHPCGERGFFDARKPGVRASPIPLSTHPLMARADPAQMW